MAHFNGQGGASNTIYKYNRPYIHPFDNSILNPNNRPNPYNHRLTYI
jgi:hypothetical protein